MFIVIISYDLIFSLHVFWIMQACGAKYQILEEMLDETDVDDVVVALVNMARMVYSLSCHYEVLSPQ